MNLETTCAISAIVAYLIIISVHAIMLFKTDHDQAMKLEHRCIICAYFIFFMNHVIELTVEYIHVLA